MRKISFLWSVLLTMVLTTSAMAVTQPSATDQTRSTSDPESRPVTDPDDGSEITRSASPETSFEYTSEDDFVTIIEFIG
ncbi:MAG: hypothetical protein Q4C47_06085, partial [Planctomycetia bacterium]|nr:hypothetical protein [Planctomycetia bacterium]